MAVPVIVILLGVIIILRAASALQNVMQVIGKQSEKCEAVVAEVITADFANEHGYKMRYETVSSDSKVIFKDVFIRQKPIKVGRRVKISYEPGNPKNFRVGHTDRRLIFPVALLFIGSIVTLIGVCFLIQSFLYI